MGQKLDELMKSMQEEIDKEETKVEENKVEETKVEDTPAEDDKATEEHTEEHTEETEEHTDDKPADDKPRQIPDDKFSRAEFAFKRQLAKKQEKYDAELKARDEKYEKLMAEFEELKKSVAPKKELRRSDFQDDEDFIRALQEDAVKKAFAERDAEDAKKAKEREAEEAKKQEDARYMQEQQKAWLNNVDRAFEGDANRSRAFLDKVQYANENGLGELLDACPVAADFLVRNPAGPRVFEKMLEDRATFERVFNDTRTSPLDIYYELRSIESELRNGGSQKTGTQTTTRPVMPNIGRPGKQAATATAPDIFEDPEAMRAFIRGH